MNFATKWTVGNELEVALEVVVVFGAASRNGLTRKSKKAQNENKTVMTKLPAAKVPTS